MITDAKIRKTALWVAKIATLVISAPATMGIVDQGYFRNETHWLVVLLVKIAALLVIEGAFLYFLQLVEDTKNIQTKEESEQNVYVYAVWAMYVLLLIVGLLHGEGLISLVLRFAIGLLLFVSTSDKLSAMRKKYEEDRIKGKRKTLKERRAEASAEEEVTLALIHAKKKAQIDAINSQGDLLERVGREVIIHRILVILPADAGNVVEGEIVDEVKPEELPAEASKPEEKEEPATNVEEKVKSDDMIIFDNGSYKVVKQGADFVVSCYACSYQDVKQGLASSNAYTSAIRAGSKHMGKHKVKQSEEQTGSDLQGFR